MPLSPNRIAPGTPPMNAPVHPLLWAMVGSWALIYAVGLLAERGVLPGMLAPWVLWTAFAFFDVKLDQALAGQGIDLQLVWSTVTHAFLHGSWLHLGLNGAAFLGLGHALTRDAGIWPVMAIFALTAAAGALTFGLVTETQVPLIGASGAVFGFLGTLTAWQERWLAERGAPRDPIWARVAGVIAINLLMGFGLGGLAIAWEAHLGGFAAGWILAYLFPPALRARRVRERWR
ncbi:MAG: rhomboid family intramembrane serine protease [Pseudomonadota bacterium]